MDPDRPLACICMVVAVSTGSRFDAELSLLRLIRRAEPDPEGELDEFEAMTVRVCETAAAKDGVWAGECSWCDGESTTRSCLDRCGWAS